MADKKVELRYDLHCERFEVLVGGESLGNFNYDNHGSSGMSEARQMIERLGDKLGFDVHITEGDDGEG